jgi:GNAT superfamily N-acetyltransferase
MVDGVLRLALADCWRDVSNAGGSVGFPFPPVHDAQVLPVLDALIASLSETRRVLVAGVGGELAGWLVLAGNTSRVTAHWAKVQRVQSALAFRGCGMGRSLMAEVERVARHELGLQHLYLELRSGLGLEAFYELCGWRRIGVWPRALYVSDEDYRDEVLMMLELRCPAEPSV